MATPLYMSQKNSSVCTIHSSKLSEISGLSLLCATLGYQSSFIFGLSWMWLFLVLLSFSREILGKRLNYYHDGVLPLLVLWGVTLYAWLISGVRLFEEKNCLLFKGSKVREKWLFFLDSLVLKEEGVISTETSRTTNPETQQHIPDDDFSTRLLRKYQTSQLLTETSGHLTVYSLGYRKRC